MTRRSGLEFNNLTRVFPTETGGHVAIEGFQATVRPGEFVSLLGHSGCGKSTALAIAAGLDRATSGSVIVDGVVVTEPGLDRALVFQSPSLLPWMSALENVVLASQRKDAARHYLELVGVAEFADQSPAQLSQGVQQRVAIARALSLEPNYLLLDEPFGALDSITRCELQDLLLDLRGAGRERKTVIMVTHDVDEALYLSDRILLMTDGPAARLGLDLPVRLNRSGTRREMVADPEYFRLRSEVIGFLEHHSRQFIREMAA